ncbi:MAG TPA: carboxy terminal-processing peptidase [Bacteroidia bacterium]|nr:carboxy terminal-processing peptidase [Bacteroidia bacterium]HRS58305.1 carboxy terminal-processing peptidase [Bacteroidia bacterium]HRU68979.1 carboxy terminal-processing peptidase [Bacteroidia bacterium]
MKKWFLFPLGIVVLFVFTSYKKPHADKDERQAILQAITQTLQMAHYLEVRFDDNFSEKLFNLYLKRLDYGKRFLTKEDYDLLKQYYDKLDDQVKATTFEFYDLSVELLLKRTAEVESWYKDLLSTPFDFKVKEYYETDEEKAEYAANPAALKESWRKYLKYQTLIRLLDAYNEQAKMDTGTVKSFEELEKEARQKVLAAHEEFFARMKKLRDSDRLALYFNCIAGVFDPHTEYYAPKQKEDFDINISGRLEGIGATLQEKGDYIKVVRIVPGSASWRQGELKAGDIILKVAQGDAEPVDIVGMRLDDAVQLIRGKAGTMVRLTVKKMDGTIKVISIVRDVVIIEESLVKSAIITDEKTKLKIGYIKLPQFYTDFTRTGGNGCAADVKVELKKLMAENVDGIVFDLRDNGGGSLQDAVDIGGYFIPNGPIVQVRSRWGSPLLLNDQDNSVVYDGPIVFMVNVLSASASEILAAAMQDYKRAVIIGAPTFGKGTVQRFIELDQFIQGDITPKSSFGSLKVTIQNFYRINGSTTQLHGVTPDIILPDIYEYAKIGEKDLDYPLPWDNIKSATYTTWKYPVNINYLKTKSAERIAKNEYFNKITEYASFLNTQNQNTNQVLTFEEYKKEMDEFNKKSEAYKNMDKEISSMKVSPLATDLITLQKDTAAMARAEEWHKEIVKDQYLYEAINTLGDIKKK